MKLATYQDGSRDGQLIVVSRDLRQAHYATGIASRMQQVLDDWGFMAPQLQDLAHQLNSGRAPHAFPFNPAQCMAPLPRAYQWLEGNAYLPYLSLTESDGTHSATEPRLWQGSGDSLVGPCEEVVVPSAALGADFGAGVAVITGDVPQGTSAEAALHAIRLVLLHNSMALRELQAQERLQGLSPLRSQIATVCSPVAVSIEELGDRWKAGRLHLPLHCRWNGRKLGQCDAGADMSFHFGQLIAHACQTRSLRAGTIIGSGPVAQAAHSRSSAKAAAASLGHSSLAAVRAQEMAEQGHITTPYLQFGDAVRVEMFTPDGQSLMGAMDTTIVSPSGDGSEHA